MKTAISCGPIYVYSLIFEQPQDEDGDPKLPEMHRKIKCHLFSAEPPPSGLALTSSATVRVSQDTLRGGISHQPEHQGRTCRIALIQFIPSEITSSF